MIFDIEAPEYDEARANMTVRQALETSLRAETKAFEFFETAAGKVQLKEVRDIFSELRDEERGHQALVKKEIAKLPPRAGQPDRRRRRRDRGSLISILGGGAP